MISLSSLGELEIPKTLRFFIIQLNLLPVTAVPRSVRQDRALDSRCVSASTIDM